MVFSAVLIIYCLALTYFCVDAILAPYSARTRIDLFFEIALLIASVAGTLGYQFCYSDRNLAMVYFVLWVVGVLALGWEFKSCMSQNGGVSVVNAISGLFIVCILFGPAAVLGSLWVGILF